MKIGFIGLPSAGKDTVAEITQRVLTEQGQDFKIKRYAELLKEGTRLAFGDNFDDRDIKEERRFVTPTLADKIIDATDYLWLKLGLDHNRYFEQFTKLCTECIDKHTWLSPREFQQYFGTDVIRTLNPNAWVEYLHRQGGNILIPDVRFSNELVDYNVLVWRQDAKEVNHVAEQFALDCMYDVHYSNPSEYRHDYTLWNKGTLVDLERNIRFMLSNIKFK